MLAWKTNLMVKLIKTALKKRKERRRKLNNMSLLALKCQRLLLKVSLSRKWIRLRLKALVSKIQAELWKLLNQLLNVFAKQILTK